MVSCSRLLCDTLRKVRDYEGTDAVEKLMESVYVIGSEVCGEIETSVAKLLHRSHTIGSRGNWIPSRPDGVAGQTGEEVLVCYDSGESNTLSKLQEIVLI